ncbi:MAG: hypothetical protein NTV70_22790 [Acidobacteria bacterium]|nr:hypothetical protein [Acidobacteriota bacterium]
MIRRLLVLMILGTASHFAATITVDFETLMDAELLTNQQSGLTFSNAIIYSAGISLNEFEFPPRSGANVASDSGGPITILFSSPVASVSAFFTYVTPISVEAYSLANAWLGTATSSFQANLGISGDAGSSPNEQLTVTAPQISRLVITGDPAGVSFTLDDLTYTESPSGVPEPATWLAGLAAAALITWKRK